MLSVPQNAPVNMISDLMKILLNEFKVKSVGVAKQPYLILYSYDVTTGVVVDLGDHLNIVPVIDGTLSVTIKYSLINITILRFFDTLKCYVHDYMDWISVKGFRVYF